MFLEVHGIHRTVVTQDRNERRHLLAGARVCLNDRGLIAERICSCSPERIARAALRPTRTLEELFTNAAVEVQVTKVDVEVGIGCIIRERKVKLLIPALVETAL